MTTVTILCPGPSLVAVTPATLERGDHVVAINSAILREDLSPTRWSHVDSPTGRAHKALISGWDAAKRRSIAPGITRKRNWLRWKNEGFEMDEALPEPVTIFHRLITGADGSFTWYSKTILCTVGWAIAFAKAKRVLIYGADMKGVGYMEKHEPSKTDWDIRWKKEHRQFNEMLKISTILGVDVVRL